jgi:apolipoprotein D and lipocalin family protein
VQRLCLNDKPVALHRSTAPLAAHFCYTHLRPNQRGDMHRLLSALLLALSATACSATTTELRHLPPLQTVSRVDLTRYLGTWYEIASFPAWFQRDCTGTTATYGLRDDGRIDVLNRCRKHTLDGPEDVSHGQARVVDRASNAKLEVSFFRPFWGPYWIIVLDPEYRYAVVGHPSRDYLWILARTPTLPEAVYAELVERVREMGYDVARLRRTVQRATGPADKP